MDAQTEKAAHQFSDEQIEHIAEKAAQKAVAKLTEEFYKQVGKSVVDKFLIVLGAVTLAGVVWFKQIKGGG